MSMKKTVLNNVLISLSIIISPYCVVIVKSFKLDFSNLFVSQLQELECPSPTDSNCQSLLVLVMQYDPDSRHDLPSGVG
jgi:hypothetical protein